MASIGFVSLRRLPAVIAFACVVLAVAAGLPVPSRAEEPTIPPQFVWFGTYTGGPAKSAGIYVSRFDAATGKLLWHNALAGMGHNDISLAMDGVSIQFLEKIVRRDR